MYKKFEYFTIREKTESGLVHSHIFFRGYFIPHSWIVDNWADFSGFEIIKIQFLKGEPVKMTGYVAKYVSKDHLRYEWSKYLVFPKFALIWKYIKMFTKYDMSLSILIFDKILESGWLYWDKITLNEFVTTYDTSRQLELK